MTCYDIIDTLASSSSKESLISLYLFTSDLPINANHYWWLRLSLLRALPIDANIHLRQGSWEGWEMGGGRVTPPQPLAVCVMCILWGAFMASG